MRLRRGGVLAGGPREELESAQNVGGLPGDRIDPLGMVHVEPAIEIVVLARIALPGTGLSSKCETEVSRERRRDSGSTSGRDFSG